MAERLPQRPTYGPGPHPQTADTADPAAIQAEGNDPPAPTLPPDVMSSWIELIDERYSVAGEDNDTVTQQQPQQHHHHHQQQQQLHQQQSTTPFFPPESAYQDPGFDPVVITDVSSTLHGTRTALDSSEDLPPRFGVMPGASRLDLGGDDNPVNVQTPQWPQDQILYGQQPCYHSDHPHLPGDIQSSQTGYSTSVESSSYRSGIASQTHSTPVGLQRQFRKAQSEGYQKRKLIPSATITRPTDDSCSVQGTSGTYHFPMPDQEQIESDTPMKYPVSYATIPSAFPEISLPGSTGLSGSFQVEQPPHGIYSFAQTLGTDVRRSPNIDIDPCVALSTPRHGQVSTAADTFSMAAQSSMSSSGRSSFGHGPSVLQPEPQEESSFHHFNRLRNVIVKYAVPEPCKPSQEIPSSLSRNICPSPHQTSPKFRGRQRSSSPKAFIFPPQEQSSLLAQTPSPGLTASPQVSPSSITSTSSSPHAFTHLGQTRDTSLESRVKEKLFETIIRRRGDSINLEEHESDTEDDRELTPEEAAKKLRRREQNRRAAQRCRQKKREAADHVVKEFRRLQSTNTGLRQEIKQLAKQKDHLAGALDAHKQICRLPEVEMRSMTTAPPASQQSERDIPDVILDSSDDSVTSDEGEV